MKNKDFTTTLMVDESVEYVFDAILDVRGWWSGLHGETFEGITDVLNEEFTFRAGGGAHYSKQKLIEAEPAKKLTWLVTESNLNFLKKTDEWNGTKINFDISAEGDKTKIVFTHIGLQLQIECYTSCAPAWEQYMQQRLVKWITKDFKQASVN